MEIYYTVQIDLVWLSFTAYQHIVVYLMLNYVYTYILNLYDL